MDDFYLNLLDWNCDSNLAVALGDSVYLWNQSTNVVENLVQKSGEYSTICSVYWTYDQRHIAIGLETGCCEVYDSETLQLVRNLRGHSDRVASIASQ